MYFIAMEWDHSYMASVIKWVVMECAGTREEENGAIQAIPPRSDVAYFLRANTAKNDAENFARAKRKEPVTIPEEARRGYRAYPWDHSAGSGLVRWAVLRSEPTLPLGREDVAYFVNPKTAEDDAALFETLMNCTGGLSGAG